MDKKQSLYVIGISLISLAISLFFGVIGWKYQELNIGMYFAVSLVGFSLLTIVVSIFIIQRINQAEINISHKIKESEITSQHHKSQLLKSLINENSFIEVYTDSKIFVNHFENNKHLKNLKHIEYYIYLNDGVDYSGANIITPSPSSVSALFFFSNNHEMPHKCLLIPNNKDFYYQPWLYISNDYLSSSIFKGFIESSKKQSVNLTNAVDKKWLHSRAKSVSDNFIKEWKLLKKNMVYYSTPLDIYKEQLSLSDGAEYIHAFDMTDIDEWFDQGNLGGCLTANVGSANNYGNDGKEKVRRIFLAPSRDYLESNLDYKEKLHRVINEHYKNNIGVGLIFQDEIRNKEYIQDFVVYNCKVVWVETVPTTRQSGAGFFSTNKVDVSKYINIFNEVWENKYPRPPSVEAINFLNKNAHHLDEETS